MLKNNSKIRVPKKYQNMLDEIDYVDQHDGYFLYARKGYYFKAMGYGGHVGREDTQTEVLKVIRGLGLCDCEQCLKRDWDNF